MKVVLVSHSPGFVGGAERSLLEIARYLHEKPSVELSVVVPAHGELGKQLEQIGITCNVIPFGWGTHNEQDTDLAITSELGKISTIYEYLATEHPDVVMTNTVVIPWFAYACKQLGIPHTWFLREAAEEGDKIPIYPDFKQAMSFIDSSSKHILVNSRYLKDYYSEVFGPKKDISVVYPSINPKILEYAKAGASVSARGPLKLVVFSSISPNKNQLEVLKAIKSLKERTSNFRLTIMGAVIDTRYHDGLIKFVADNDLGQYVDFVEKNNEPYKVVAKHDICIVPSVNESFGRVTVEAMLLGKVVVASDSSGSKEVVGDSPGAFLYKLGDSEALAGRLYKLVDNPEGLGDMGKKAHDYAVKRFLHTDGLNLLYKVLEKASREQRGQSDWISLGLANLAKKASSLNSKLAEANRKRHEQQEVISHLQQSVAERQELLDDIVNSRRWRFMSSLLKPLGWFRKLD